MANLNAQVSTQALLQNVREMLNVTAGLRLDFEKEISLQSGYSRPGI
jgi:hypothetical protein